MKHRHGGHADRDGNDFNIVGGQSFIELPIRTVFYASYSVYPLHLQPLLLLVVARHTMLNDLAP